MRPRTDRLKRRVAWLTDLHFDFVSPSEIEDFLCRVVSYGPDAVLFGGDLAESHSVGEHLLRIARALGRPVYFVLGNHDFYGGSIRGVRAAIRELCRHSPHLQYLTDGGVYELAPGVGLVGHDGWADGRIGDYDRSDVMLNDYLLIEELAGYDRAARRPQLELLGDEAAASIRRSLPEALAKYPEVYLLTHVPPLREACWHEGHISDDDWAPHFTCKAMGDAILAIMAQHPDRRLTVLCGHTHSNGVCYPLNNVTIYTGKAIYGMPGLQRVFEFEPGP